MVVGWNVLKDLGCNQSKLMSSEKSLRKEISKSSVDRVTRTVIPAKVSVSADSPALSARTNLSECKKTDRWTFRVTIVLSKASVSVD